jgi:hypothetical protein
MATFYVTQQDLDESDEFFSEMDTCPDTALRVVQAQLNGARSLASFEAALDRKRLELDSEADRVHEHWTERLQRQLEEGTNAS